MLKKSLIAIAVLAIAMPAIAGEMKFHDWPTQYVPDQTLATIDVELDVGYYIHIVDQDPIKVQQDTTSDDPYHTYVGCKTSDVEANFTAELTISVASASSAGGSWSGTITPSTITPDTESIEICITGTDVAIEELPGGTKQKVAVATIKVLVPF